MSLSYSQSISIKKIKFSVMNKIKIKYLNNKDEDFNIFFEITCQNVNLQMNLKNYYVPAQIKFKASFEQKNR